MQDDMFERDDQRAKANEGKHSVTFDYAADLLLGDYVAFQANVSGKPRIKATARDRCEHFVAAYTERKGRLRIISARHASEKEAATYERYNNRGIRPPH